MTGITTRTVAYTLDAILKHQEDEQMCLDLIDLLITKAQAHTSREARRAHIAFVKDANGVTPSLKGLYITLDKAEA